MGLQCKVCATELDAFSGGRCRHCRQLVCAACIAQGAASAPGGLLCKDCASHQAAIEKDAPAVPAPVIRRRYRAPTWVWGMVAATLAGVFLLIVVKPYVDDSAAVGMVLSGTDEEYQRALDHLAAAGGSRALALLTETLPDSNGEKRNRVIRAIGAIPGGRALTTLTDLRDSPKTPSSSQIVIYEAILEHFLRHPKESMPAIGYPPPVERDIPVPVPAD